MNNNLNKAQLNESVMPDKDGFFGEYGGCFVPPMLEPIMKEITEAYQKIKDDPVFKEELYHLQKH